MRIFAYIKFLREKLKVDVTLHVTNAIRCSSYLLIFERVTIVILIAADSVTKIWRLDIASSSFPVHPFPLARYDVLQTNAIYSGQVVR